MRLFIDHINVPGHIFAGLTIDESERELWTERLAHPGYRLSSQGFALVPEELVNSVVTWPHDAHILCSVAYGEGRLRRINGRSPHRSAHARWNCGPFVREMLIEEEYVPRVSELSDNTQFCALLSALQQFGFERYK